MNIFDTTKLESAATILRHWVDRRRGEPSHWWGMTGGIGVVSLAGLILWAASVFGAPLTLLALWALGSAGFAYAGQRSEG